MNYTFPYISNINDVLPYLEGHDEFSVIDKNEYIVIDYHLQTESMFRGPGAEYRRECRGIIFNKNGDIIRRPYHKFFNVNEREESSLDTLSLSDQNYIIMTKEDGSMLSPFMLSDDLLVWGTKKGSTEVSSKANNFLNLNPNYMRFAFDVINDGMTPIFEFCSRSQRIVLDYPDESLILTGIRNIHSGEYMRYDDMINLSQDYGINLVHCHDMQDMSLNEIHRIAKDLVDTEGFVIRFHDGHSVKAKGDWYVAIHKAKEAILWDRNIVQLILDGKLDDVKSHLDANEKNRLNEFEFGIVGSISQKTNFVMSNLPDWKKLSRKEFAIGPAQKLDKYIKDICFNLFDKDLNWNDVNSLIRNKVANNLNSNTNYNSLANEWFEGYKYNV